MSFSLTLSHVGVFVTDVSRMVDFYTRFLGFAVSDREKRADGEIVFLTRDPREHHQFVIASGRPSDVPFNPINQLSFRVDSLATLRAMYQALKNEPVEILGTITHGNALSVYFRDPEKNRVELLIDTPWYVPQPYRVPTTSCCLTPKCGPLSRSRCARCRGLRCAKHGLPKSSAKSLRQRKSANRR